MLHAGHSYKFPTRICDSESADKTRIRAICRNQVFMPAKMPSRRPPVHPPLPHNGTLFRIVAAPGPKFTNRFPDQHRDAVARTGHLRPVSLPVTHAPGKFRSSAHDERYVKLAAGTNRAAEVRTQFTTQAGVEIQSS